MLNEIPQAFLARMARLLGDQFDEFEQSYAASPAAALRVNTLKVSPGRFRALAPFDLAPLPWVSAGFQVVSGDDQRPGRHPYHAAGLYYLQEPSAMAVAQLLDPQPGERILDLAAAPGGKATHIAALMHNRGLFVANEVHPKRVWELAGNLERWGVRNAIITNESPERLADRLGGFFDRVLVDAPCSGEGMFRKSEAARVEWTPALIPGCALRQSAILEQAARMVRAGGWLCYSTCTFAPEENEGVVARFLREHPEFELAELLRWPGAGRGRPDWLEPEDYLPELEHTIRLWPHRTPGEGHFIAVLERSSDDGIEAPARPWQPATLSGEARRLFEGFCGGNLTAMPAVGELASVGSYVYGVPTGAPDLADLRVVHPGWWLGTLKKNRFEPGHALAMGLEPADVQRVVDMPADSPEVLAYLRGEALRSTGEDGWVLVAVDGYSLGWGKRVAGVVKNHYPRGLRWLGGSLNH